MTQFSMLPWETQTGTGDGANSYTQDQANNFFRYFDVRDPANEGVAFGVLNALVVSGTASPLSVASGAAVCYGRYWNDAAVALTVTTPVVGTTGGRVVLRTDWSANTTRLFVKMSTDGNGSIPALVQTAGTTWEISLATFTITTGGVITVTDNRTFIKVTGKLGAGDIDDVGMIANALITGAKLVDETIPPAKIANRTRKFFVHTPAGYNISDSLQIVDGGTYLLGYTGIVAPNSKVTEAIGKFMVPLDFVSGMTITPIFGLVGADYAFDVTAEYGPVGGSVTTDSSGTQTGSTVNPYALTLTNEQAGDFVDVIIHRLGTDVLDTHASDLTIKGFIVEYTADS